jgi:hypothetical protein
MSVRIRDLIQLEESVEVSPGHRLPIHGIPLNGIVQLFTEHQEEFMALYAKGQAMGKGSKIEALAPFLLAAPDFVAAVVAIGSDTQGQEEDIKKMPATVQLIALHAIWKLSVPDPKKAQELLSEVMDQLRKLSQKAKTKTSARKTSTPLSETSVEPSSSSAPMDTPLPE